MINFTRKPRYGYEDLLEIIRLLRSPEGCPWDRVQTHQSIRRGMLEEAYEAAEAIDTDNAALLKEELGDVLMQVVFHAGIEADAGRFDMDDVCDGVVKKLLYRHPHVFGSAHEDSPESVLISWDQLKRAEKGQATTGEAMEAVARSLPGLWRAEKLQKKAADAGFDWPDVQGALDDMRAFWGGMLQMGATTFWEDFSVDWMQNAAPIDEIVPEGKKDIHGDFGAYCYRGFRHSLCHGWSSGPATFLLRYVLGVKPLEPGFERVRVRPQLGDLRYAKGAVPTPRGLLRVEAERQPDGSVRVKIDAPEGITVEQ